MILIFALLITMSLKQLHTVSVAKGELEARDKGETFLIELRQEVSMIQSDLTLMSEMLLMAREQKSWTRDQVVELLQQYLSNQTGLMGIYTLWEPDQFDRQDKANALKPLYNDPSGRFTPYVYRTGSSIRIEPLHGFEKEGSYYTLAKKSKKFTVMEPYFYQTNGEDTLLTSLVVPILDKNGEFLGIVGADLTLDALQQRVKQTSNDTAYVTIFSDKGTYIAHGIDDKKVNVPYGDRQEKIDLFNGAVSGIMQAYSLNPNGEPVNRTFEKITFRGSDQSWYVETVVLKKEVMSTFNEVLRSSLLVAVVSLILLALLITLVLRLLVTRNLNEANRMLGIMASGDFTQQMTVRSRDEFGQMAEHFNHMIDTQRKVLLMVSELSTSAGMTSQQLAASAEQTGQAAETIAESVQNVAIGAELQEQQTTEASRAMTEMAVGVGRVAESSSGVTESIQDVVQQTKAGSERIQQAIEQMNAVQQTSRQSEAAIERLQVRSVEIGSIMELISQISMQTNLLALNAGIEAARAGEHGRGFAIVAGEVRKLAEQTKDAAAKVEELLEEIRNETEKAAAAARSGSAEVRMGVESVTETGHIFTVITAEMGTVQSQMEEVSAAAEQMSAGTEQVTATVEELARIAQEAASHSQSVAAASEEQLASMEEISTSSASLSSMVKELLNQLSRFKV
ncbi:methyl-accepting chemotaxis protein [Paenibacillus puerhi]|uniref:methyl-accepting chemotaxis protein n=1 Tax=Paenibacillus puerhi TaxID=2692622 RepID=UPI0013569EC9|nr:methyl-accepting chemotaxis protein [Paenibacillus puerhi]